MANQAGVTQQQGDSITKLIEEFSDFKTENELMLPHTYKVQLSIESLNRRALQDWTFTLSREGDSPEAVTSSTLDQNPTRSDGLLTASPMLHLAFKDS